MRLFVFGILGVDHQLKKIQSLLKENSFGRYKVSCVVREGHKCRTSHTSDNNIYFRPEISLEYQIQW